MSLLTKLSEKLKNLAYKIGHSKIVKGGLAFAMGLSIAIGATACGGAQTPDTPQDPDHSYTDPTDPSNPSNPTDTTDPYSQYSDILKTILTTKKSYYDNLIIQYRETQEHSYIDPLPYKLLSDLGLNVDQIRQGNFKDTFDAYIKGEDTSKLYVTSKIEDSYNGTPYYHCITACYKLSKEEYKDLERLYKGEYIHGPLFIQELSYQKEPIDYTYSKITTEAYTDLLNSFKDSTIIKNLFGSNSVVMDFLSFSITDQNFNISIRRSSRENGLMGVGKITNAVLRPTDVDIHITTIQGDGSIFTGPTLYWTGSPEELTNNCESIIDFNSSYSTYLHSFA